MDPLAALLGDAPEMMRVRQEIRRLLTRASAARRLPPVLLLGETGTGKGLLAHAIHEASPRREARFMDLNCAAIPDGLIESELFGFERGAFTDARQAKLGLFRAAHGGILFLDEIGLLPLPLQAKLLKVIEEQTVRPLGGTRSEPVDVWVVSATSVDLIAANRAGRFREDLYHRLALFTVRLPPLRERGEDVLRLAEHFLRQLCADYGLPPKTFGGEARAALRAHAWPGNVRELSNVVERTVLLSETREITADDLGLGPGASAPAPREDRGAEPSGLRDAVARLECDQLVTALERTGWNLTRTAVLLGVSRDQVRYRVAKYGLRSGDRASGDPAAAPARAGAPIAPPATRPEPEGSRWEVRRLALLRAQGPDPDADQATVALPVAPFLVEKVRSFGGHVEALSPTGLVAVFGLEPVEDAPRRAVLVALALRRAFERRPDAPAHGLRSAIHVVQVPIGRVGDANQIDLDAKREAWAVLDRMVAATAPGAIVVSDAAVPFVGRRFELTPLEPGTAAWGRLHQLVAREAPGAAPRQPTTFVGREQELALLRSRLAAALGGRGQVVGILGDPGIGKSRLLEAFRQTLGETPAQYLEGQCYTHGVATPYLQLLTMLRQHLGIGDADSHEITDQRVRQGLERLGLDPRDGAPFLRLLLGLDAGTDAVADLSPEGLRARTFELVRQMCLRIAERQPIILVVEDLHWSDPTSEAWLRSLVDRVASAPILLIATYRPGYRPPWGDRSYVTQLALPPLSPEESRRVIRSMCQDPAVPERLAQVIVDKAEGNPFFLEELAWAALERDERALASGVPDAIEEVLRARIDRLGEPSRRILQTAAVLGRAASRGLIRALWRDPGAVEPHLEELTRLEYLYEQGGAAEPVYIFKHALIRDAAYANLPPAVRRALHAAAGDLLEQRHAGRLDEVADMLAYHFTGAEDPDKAQEYWLRFAGRAARMYAHAEAVAALQAARGQLDHQAARDRGPRVLDLVLREAHSLSFLGRFQEIVTLLREHRSLIEPAADPAVAGRYALWLAHAHCLLGDPDQATVWANEALAHATAAGDAVTQGRAAFVRAYERFWSGCPTEGIQYGRQAVAQLTPTAERWWLGRAHWVVAINQALLGAFPRALDALAEEEAIGRAIQDPRLQSSAAWTRGLILGLRREWDAALAACRQALQAAPDAVDAAVASGFLGGVFLEMGDGKQAMPWLERATRQVGEFGVRQTHGWFMTLLAEAHGLVGEHATARQLALEGLRLAQATRYRYGIGRAHLALARIARARGDLGETGTRLHEAVDTFAAIPARYDLGRAHLDLAEVAHAQREPDRVRAQLQAAASLFAALDVSAYVERTHQLAQEFAVSLT